MTFYRASEYHDSAVNTAAIATVKAVSRAKKPYGAILCHLSLHVATSRQALEGITGERGAHKRARRSQEPKERSEHIGDHMGARSRQQITGKETSEH